MDIKNEKLCVNCKYVQRPFGNKIEINDDVYCNYKNNFIKLTDTCEFFIKFTGDPQDMVQV